MWSGTQTRYCCQSPEWYPAKNLRMNMGTRSGMLQPASSSGLTTNRDLCGKEGRERGQIGEGTLLLLLLRSSRSFREAPCDFWSDGGWSVTVAVAMVTRTGDLFAKHNCMYTEWLRAGWGAVFWAALISLGDLGKNKTMNKIHRTVNYLSYEV